MIVFYISGHGFGHASRDLEVVREIRARQPQAAITIRSSVPRWFLDSAGIPDITIETVETDVGMAQLDSLRIDVDETARRAAAFYRQFDRRAAEEAEFLKRSGASVVVGDIPPLAFEAAEAADLPSIALANFTWDWIYEFYPQFDDLAPGVIEIIRDTYGTASMALRLPFHGGFASMTGRVRDIPLIARRAAHSKAEVRQLLQLPEGPPVVLASFGGHGQPLPYAQIARDGGFTLLVTDHEAASGPADGPLVRLTLVELQSKGLRYTDLVAASDVVVSKPGYGIVSECMANGAALLHTSRGRFAEQDVFVAIMPNALRSRFLPQEDLLAGRWSDGVRALLAQPQVTGLFGLNGADVAADAILSLHSVNS